jgi:hypothetical protein
MSTQVSLEQDELREKVVEVARRHKASWMELGQYLYTIQRNKMYKYWGFIEFDGYCMKELGIKPLTALKMMRSYQFLEREEPKVIEARSGEDNLRKIPSFEAVNILRLARKNKFLTAKDLDHIREEVLEDGKEPKEVRAHVRKLLSDREEKDPAEVRKSRRNAAIKRLISVLANTKKELESAHLLPAHLLKQMSELEQKLEDQIE